MWNKKDENEKKEYKYITKIKKHVSIQGVAEKRGTRCRVEK